MTKLANGTGDWNRYYSQEDDSVNFFKPTGDHGKLEARYVRREQDYFICYLSSATGCNRSCRFCHLTQTKQTMYSQATFNDFLNQAHQVFEHYTTQSPAKKVHFNFMARGEPLDNAHVRDPRLMALLDCQARSYGIDEVKFNISTIMPKKGQARTLNPEIVRLYYSLYSLDPKFRRRWLPHSADPRLALKALKKWGGEVKLHWAFIKDENDSQEGLYEIIDCLHDMYFHPDINIIQYNPFNCHSQASPQEVVATRVAALQLEGFNVKQIPRVGFDVAASCGMFLK